MKREEIISYTQKIKKTNSVQTGSKAKFRHCDCTLSQCKDTMRKFAWDGANWCEDTPAWIGNVSSWVKNLSLSISFMNLPQKRTETREKQRLVNSNAKNCEKWSQCESVFSLMASRGRVHWLRKEVQLYRSLGKLLDLLPQLTLS